MKVRHGVKEKVKERKKVFEKRQAEAFRQFMRAHFGDPVCQDALFTTFTALSKN